MPAKECKGCRMKTKYFKEHYTFTIKDFMLLKKIGRQKNSRYKDYDFSTSIVFKPWGMEYLFYEDTDKSACGWMLHINKGFGTSLHCHMEKDTMVYVISGILHLTTSSGVKMFMPGDMMLIDKKVFHAMAAVVDDTRIIELEAPSKKTDSIRVKDYWKREKKPYESNCFILNWKQTPPTRNQAVAGKRGKKPVRR